MERLLQLIEAPLIWLSGALRKPTGSENPVLDKSGIGFSLLDDTYGQRVSLPKGARAKHTYTLGTTGAGKTNLILKLIEEDIDDGHSVVVLDLRGDLVHRGLELCLAKGVPRERIVLLDLREKDVVVGFNPLAGEGEPFVKALHLLDVVRSESEGWGVQLEETMRNCFLLLAESNRYLTDIEQMLFDMSFLDDLVDQSDEPGVVDFFQRYMGLSEEKQLSWALPVLNKITPLLATPGLRCVLGSENDIMLDRVLALPGSVFLVSLAVDELHRSSRMLGSLIVSAITRTMMARVNLPEAKRNAVRLYVDEFENMASDSFESLIAEGRRFKLSLVLSHQNLAQLPPKLRAIIRNNVGLQILFNCGYQDAKELAPELPKDFDIENLLALAPGQMFMMERGGETKLVSCDLSKISVNQMELVAFRNEILAHIGSPAKTVQNAIKSRRNSECSIESLQHPWDLGEDDEAN